ncbi:MAG: hypothetical protein LBG45_11230 [Dysgonamonadaceae bacterium]|jgi:hypothetical protein|nr:hypothetical protein [Dysgonamonadaceae bacterium]
MNLNLNLPVSTGTLCLYYGAVIISLLVVYATGWLMKYFLFKTGDRISAFSILTCSVLGLTSIVVIYSILFTKGLTANWILAVLFLLYIYCRKKEKRTAKSVRYHSSSVWKYATVILLINAVFFCYFAFRIIDLEHGMFAPYSFDLDYYAKLSQYLTLGYENGLLEYNFFKYIAPQPYHYFELWVNAILYKTFGLNAAVSFMIAVPMFFNTLIYIALLAVMESRVKMTFTYLLLAFVGLLLASVIPYLTEILPAIKGGTIRLSYPKFSPMFLFLLASAVLFLHGRKQESYYVLLSVPVLNVIPIVAIWGTIGIFLLTDIYRKHAIAWKYWTPFICVIFLYLLYMLQSPSRVVSSTWSEPFHWGLLRLYLTQPVLYLLAYLHFIILLFFLDKKRLLNISRKAAPIFCVLCFLTITASILMRPYHYDATQFVTGTIPMFMYILVVVTFLLTVVSVRLTRGRKALLACFCGIGMLISCDAYRRDLEPWTPVFYDYNQKILEAVSPGQKEYRIGFYIGEETKGNYVSGITDAVTIPDVLDYYCNNVYHYSINTGNQDIYGSTTPTPFSDCYTAQKMQSPDISDDEIRIGFIKDNAIEYIRIYKSASPSGYFLSKLTLLAENKISGERFYKVN